MPFVKPGPTKPTLGYRDALRQEIADEIRSDPANTLFGVSMPLIRRMLAEYQQAGLRLDATLLEQATARAVATFAQQLASSTPASFPWIKVTDRLPEPGTDVIVHNGFLGVATYRHPHHRDEWWDVVAGGPWSLVTHWMPTPEDPR